MKTSDKLLLGTCLAAIALIVGANLALYARYRKGDILTAKDIYRQNHIRQVLPAPAYLWIRGISEVYFIPAGQFAIEFEKGGILKEDIIYPQAPVRQKRMVGIEEVIQPRYFRAGDTLVIDGYDSLADMPRQPHHVKRGDNTYRTEMRPKARMLNVYGLTGGIIELEDGTSYIAGNPGREGGDYRFVLKSNKLHLGQDESADAAEDTTGKSGHIRILSVTATDGSELELSRFVHVGYLTLDLDATSSLTELNGWDIDQIHLNADEQSQMSISGRLMKKILEPPVHAQGTK